jgi:O-antigen ligase
VMLAGIAGYFVAVELLPDTFARILEGKGSTGLKTERWAFWLQYIPVILSHPFGVGLTAAIVVEVARESGIPVVPHNIYMNMALQTGFVGLFAFLALVGVIVLQNLAALRRVLDPSRRQLLFQLFVAVNAFLLVGLAEPVYDNGQKLNNFFWLMCGVSLSTSLRMLAEVRRERAESVVAAHGAFEQTPAPGL